MITNSFGQVLQKIRIEQGLSQEELAFKAALHRTYISDLERDRKSPSLRSVEKIACVLGLSMFDLIHRMYEWETQVNLPAVCMLKYSTQYIVSEKSQ